MSGRPGRPSGSSRGRGGDGGIAILPIIGGLVLGAGLLAFAYYNMSLQKSSKFRKDQKNDKNVCPKILLNKRRWPSEEDDTERLKQQLKKEEEECKKLEKQCAEAILHKEQLKEKLKEKMEKLAKPRTHEGLMCVNNPDLKKYLPIIAGVTVGMGVLSLLCIGCKPAPSNLTPLPMSSKPIPYGDRLTPTAVTLEDSEIDECEECLKIDPRKRRWPTLEEEQEEYKRIRERDEQKRKLEILVQECINKYEKSFECDNTEAYENASGPWEK